MQRHSIPRTSVRGALAVVIAGAALIGCNEQPTGRDFADPAAPIAASQIPAATPSSAAASTQSVDAARLALLKTKMEKPELVGTPFEDALKKLQPGQHFRFVVEFSSKEDNWRASGQSNGRSLAYQLVTQSESFAGDWLVGGDGGTGGGYFRKGQNNYQMMGFQPELQKRMLQAIKAIPSAAASLQRLKDDFAGGAVAAKFTTPTLAGKLDIWLDERKSEFRKFSLVGADQSVLTIELSELGEPQVLPSPPVKQPW